MPPEDVKSAAKACYWSIRDAMGHLQKARMILSGHIGKDKDAELLVHLISQLEGRLEPGRQLCRGLAGEQSDLEYWRKQLEFT